MSRGMNCVSSFDAGHREPSGRGRYVIGRTLIAAAPLLALTSLTGCRAVSGMRAAPLTEGVRRSYDADYRT